MSASTMRSMLLLAMVPQLHGVGYWLIMQAQAERSAKGLGGHMQFDDAALLAALREPSSRSEAAVEGAVEAKARVRARITRLTPTRNSRVNVIIVANQAIRNQSAHIGWMSAR